MPLPTPDPSASLTPFQTWVTEVTPAAVSAGLAAAFAILVGLLLVVFLLGIVSASTAYRP